MLINRTVTKKILETIVHETFSNFGSLSSSSLLDSLKLLGFYYATNAGISINIEDLKTPDVKRKFIQTANDEINYVSNQWEQGFVSDTERFQSIIDSWNIATESLKNRIVDYYQNFDPANNLYIMAFSGARGNMSQVRQLVGMRGLMSDQEGKIIDLPIQANFREGLSSIDYIISSYGARKGIVDTALKTADSGYLTRRLIYVAQDLIIREIDCRTKSGVIVLLNKKTNTKNILGRTLISAKLLKSPSITLSQQNISLTSSVLNELKELAPLTLNVRSSLTCKSSSSICQSCYGWDLAHGKLISLGEAVGIIAAQSIGEPGTQLTMRTFHTGGIFTNETLKQIVSPFSGKLIIPKSLKTISYRTNHGIMVSKLQQESILTIINWKGIKKEVFLDIGSFLYIGSTSFVRQGQLIAEYSTQSFIPGARRLKPIYTTSAGEIRFENLLVRKMLRDKRTVKVNQDDGVLWIASGKIFPLPKEANYNFLKKLSFNCSFANLKVITPYKGIVEINDKQLIIKTFKNIFSIELSNFNKNFKNCTIKFSSLIRNYQYVDKHSILGFLEIFPNYEGKIYSIRKKDSMYINTFFIITETDVWKINSDQVNNFHFFQDKKVIVRSGNLITPNSKFSRSGFFLKKDGFKMIFQNATPIFLSRGTILNYKQGDFVLENKIFATLVNYTQQTEDIVQGLPKIEELVEARRPKVKCNLAIRPGILFNLPYLAHVSRKFENGIIQCRYITKVFPSDSKSKRKQEKQSIYLAHSVHIKEELIIYNQRIYKSIFIPSYFSPIYKDKSEQIIFVTPEQKKVAMAPPKKEKPGEKKEKEKKPRFLLINGKKKDSYWDMNQGIGNIEGYQASNILYKYRDNKILEWTKIKASKNDFLFQNRKGDYIVQTVGNNYLFLEYLNPIVEYELSLSSKVLFETGSFVDIGEPITEGIIDVHELLAILFKYHSILDGTIIGTLKSLTKFQLLLVNSVQAIYQSQGVNISSKHIEIIVRQMTSKVVIKDGGHTPLLPGELIRISLINEIYNSYNKNGNSALHKIPKYEPLLLSATNSSLSKDGFLSAAGFQETKRVLTKAAIEGSSDWLRGLKECIIVGRLIPAGSAFLNYKNYLDNVYLFKD